MPPGAHGRPCRCWRRCCWCCSSGLGRHGIGFSRPRFEQGAWWEPLSAQFVHLTAACAGHYRGCAAAGCLAAGRTAATRAHLAVLAGAGGRRAAAGTGCRLRALRRFSGALHGWLGGALALARAPATAAPRWQRLLLGAAPKVGLNCWAGGPSARELSVYYPHMRRGLAGGPVRRCHRCARRPAVSRVWCAPARLTTTAAVRASQPRHRHRRTFPRPGRLRVGLLPAQCRRRRAYPAPHSPLPRQSLSSSGKGAPARST